MTKTMKNHKLPSGLLLGNGRLPNLFRFFVLIVIPFALTETYFIVKIVYNFSLAFGICLPLYIFALISAIATAVAYLGDIYDMEKEIDKIPFRYFMACFFGLGTPHIHINHSIYGSLEQEMVEKIGGPAHLDVDPGFVVLTEALTAPVKIYGQGNNHFLSRRERIREIVDLREQEGTIGQVTATTRDGIPVTVENIKFNYRIWDSRWDTLYRDNSITRKPYPFSKQAIFDYAYKRSVGLDPLSKPQLTPWEKAVGGRIQGIIREYISEHKLDDVIAPRDQQNRMVREEIRKKAYEESFQEKLKGIGTILRWWDPGEFSSQKDVEKQFIANWSVDIASNIRLNQAHGNAQKAAYEELGRAEAEAELLMSIIHALDGIQMGRDKAQTRQNLENLILLRTAQVIKALNIPPPDEPIDKNSKTSRKDEQEG
jgi:hypothetical protein